MVGNMSYLMKYCDSCFVVLSCQVGCVLISSVDSNLFSIELEHFVCIKIVRFAFSGQYF